MERKLYKFFIYSLLIRIIVFLIGPYSYQIVSVSGLLYMFFVDFLFAIGLCSTKKIRFPSIVFGHSNDYLSAGNCDLSKTEKKLLMFFVILSFFFFALWIFDWQRNIGFQNLFSDSDIRRLISEKRTTASKVGEFGAAIGVIPYLISNTDEKYDELICKRLSYFTMWFPGIISFASGARWGIVSCSFLFILVSKSKMKKVSRKDLFRIKPRILLPGIVLLIGFSKIIKRIILLFQVRGINHGANRYLISMGDMSLKPIWAFLLDRYYHIIDTICSISMYFAQPIPVFSYVFSQYSHSRCFYGANMFRVFGFLLNSIGLSFTSFKEIYNESFSGLYTSYIYGFIIDWGVYFTPIIVLITGIVFSIIETRYLRYNKYKALYPLLEVMVIFAPYYYFFQIGGMDYILFWLMVFSLLMKIRIRRY